MAISLLLKKVFNLREKNAQSRGLMRNDEEKPFLEHLEDLRVMVTRVVLTLLITAIACFVFNEKLFEVMTYPITLAGLEEKMGLDEMEAEKRGEDAESAEPGEGGEAEKPDAAKPAAPAAEAEAGGNWAEMGVTGPDNAEISWQVKSKSAGALRVYLDGVEVEAKTEGESGKVTVAVPEGEHTLRWGVFGAGSAHEAIAELEAKRKKSSFLQVLGVPEMFLISLKLSFYAAIVLSFPILLYYIADFVLPGLTPKEKKAVLPAVAIGFALFLIGVTFSYYVVLPRALNFFYHYADDRGIENAWRIGYYIKFATGFVFVFGLCFELPVVVMTLVKLDILSYQVMRNSRSVAIVIILVIGAILTPTPDALTLALLGVPMIILYEICIWLAWWLEKRSPADEDDWDIDDDDDDDPDGGGSGGGRRAAAAGASSAAPVAAAAAAHTQPYDADHHSHHGEPDDDYHHHHDHDYDHDHHADDPYHDPHHGGEYDQDYHGGDYDHGYHDDAADSALKKPESETGSETTAESGDAPAAPTSDNDGWRTKEDDEREAAEKAKAEHPSPATAEPTAEDESENAAPSNDGEQHASQDEAEDDKEGESKNSSAPQDGYHDAGHGGFYDHDAEAKESGGDEEPPPEETKPAPKPWRG